MLGPDCSRVVMYMLPAPEEQAFLPGQKVTQQHKEISPGLGRQRQEDHTFEAYLSCKEDLTKLVN